MHAQNKFLLIIVFLFTTAAVHAQLNVSVTVNLDDSLRPISPFIFGTNQLLSGGENWTAFRQGGNRLTGYNWENNASNAGSDYLHQNDDYLPWVSGIATDSSNIPGIVTTTFHNQSLKSGAYSLVTLQMAGYAAKDKNGPVSLSEKAPSARWAEVKFKKGGPFSLQPDLNDSAVFMDEYVNFLTSIYGRANTDRGIRGYALDNEPDLWPSTHPRIHPDSTRCLEIVQRSVALSTAVKDVDPSAEIFGLVSYGFNGFYNFQGAPDWNSVSAGRNYAWFIDYYLDQMKSAGAKAGKRLLDVLDLHWYPEAMSSDGHRISDASATTTADAEARVQAPRTLWDPNYVENSWIGQWFSGYLPLIPKLQQSIDKYYPGTRLAFTEFTYGGENDISGGVAMADVLGIFTKYGVYFANFWQMNSQSPYVSAAYRIYRNYDGNNGSIGTFTVPSRTNDSANCSVYASTGSDRKELHLIAINKNSTKNINGSFSIASSQKLVNGKTWRFNESSAQIQQFDSVAAISGNAFVYVLPPMSVTHLVLKFAAGTDAAEDVASAPVEFKLGQNFPNPFSSTTGIRFELAKNAYVTLKVYDAFGREVRTLVDGYETAGSHSANFDANNIPCGVYSYRLQAGGFSETKRFVIAR